MAGQNTLETNEVFSGNGVGPKTQFVPAESYVDNAVLASDTEETFAVPAGYRYVIFSATADFWCAFDRTASVPATDNTSGTGSVLNPTARAVLGVTNIHLISSTSNKISLTFFK